MEIIQKLTTGKINQLIQNIKKKKEFSTLDEKFILENLIQVLKRNSRLIPKLQNLTSRSADYKKIMKLVRTNLRKWYGLFRSNSTSKIALLVDELSRDPEDSNLIIKILQQHSSTKERLADYSQLYRNIFAITGKPKTILDLGCGLNPFSIQFMNLPQLTYYAYDVSPPEITAINLFLKIKRIGGQALVKDIMTLSSLPSADVAFLFKMTDMIDKGRGHKSTEELLKRIPVKYVVVSFATLTMSRKPMRAPRRKWMEWLCRRLGYSYNILETTSELFYVIKKS